MRRQGLCTLVALLLLSLSGVAQTPPPSNTASTPTTMPVQRVVLYKSGVGFFEHVGRVSGNDAVTVTFTSAQLNDVLKSLTALDLGGGRVTGVTYDSTLPPERQLASLHLAVNGDRPSYYELLDALRGARVAVEDGARQAEGRLLTVDRQILTRERDTTGVQDAITVMTEAGALQRFAVSPSLSVRLAEGDLRGRVGRYLDLMASTHAQDLRRVTISTSGTGPRDLYVSYISEVPVWKSTYRLVLPAKAGEKPLLQGWAIVDNTVGEDWENVELSLIAGAPQSFIQPIARPHYVKRPSVPLPQYLSPVPQTHEGTLTAGAEPAAEPAAERASVDQLRVGGVLPVTPASGGEVARRAAMDVRATAQPVGELFEYRLTEPITIRQNQSALVPIVQGEVVAEKVALWNGRVDSRHPWSALWLTNTSGVTLDGGSLAVIDDNAFAGEAVIEALTPNEKRFVSYATDLALRVDTQQEKVDGRVTRVRVDNGTLIQQVHECSRWSYTARNEADEARRLIIEHPTRDGWSLQGSTTPIETSASAYRFEVTVQPGREARLVVNEGRPVESRYAVSELTSERVARLVRQRALADDQLRALQRIVDKKQDIAALQSEIDRGQNTLDRVAADQERLRENMKALEQSDEERRLAQRYTRQLDEQEDDLARLRGELADLDAKRRTLDAELRELIQQLSLDVTGSATAPCTA